jgi:hypothetical protein
MDIPEGVALGGIPPMQLRKFRSNSSQEPAMRSSFARKALFGV